MRLRGLECAAPSRYAEAFYAPKVVLSVRAGPDAGLVTGSHGYIGSVLAPRAGAGGPRRRRARHVFYDGCDFGCDLAPMPTTRRDVRDVTAARPAGFDAVVHLAALSNDPIGDLNERWTYDINLDGDARVARAARRRVSGGSSSPRPAPCTALSEPTSFSTRTRRYGR